MYRASDLTPGERLWLRRRREGTTQLAEGRSHNVTEWQYSEWEHDRRQPVPYVGLYPRALTPGEQCALARRRGDVNLRRLSELTGLSHVTVLKHENSTKRGALWAWWAERGWPDVVGGMRRAG